MRKYFGMVAKESRTIFATVTGQMQDGTLVYTEIEQTEDGAIVTENNEPKLILDNQYIRLMRNGWQEFIRI